MPLKKNKLYIGTSGIVVPVAQSNFPDAFKEKSRLSYYASLLNSLEVNSSFYKNPRVSTLTRWVSEVGDDFKFTFKIPKLVSHVKYLAFDPTDVLEFLALVDHVGKMKGCLLIQFPPSLKVDALPALKKLLQIIRKTDESSSWDIAVEFRDSSWYTSKVETALSNFNSCIVLHDHPKAPTPLEISQELFYLRFHGEGGRYRGSYDISALSPYAEIARKFLLENKHGYAYFNNTMGDAFANAKMLEQLTLH